MKNTPTIYEQIIITAERTRELRQQRYGSMERGMFDPMQNKRLSRTVDTAIEEFESSEIGREYLYRSLERVKDKNTKGRMLRKK